MDATMSAFNATIQNLYDHAGQQIFRPNPIVPKETALVLIDIQETLRSDHYRQAIGNTGLDTAPFEPVFQMIDMQLSQILAKISSLMSGCRKAGIPVIHTIIESYFPDARDTGRLHAAAGMFAPPGSQDARILAEAVPLPGEVVLKKTCSGIVTGTPIDRILRNMGIKQVIVAGFYTDQCISTSVRDLADLGYAVTLPEDAVGALSPERHENAMQSLRGIYAYIEKTDALLNRISKT